MLWEKGKQGKTSGVNGVEPLNLIKVVLFLHNVTKRSDQSFPLVVQFFSSRFCVCY